MAMNSPLCASNSAPPPISPIPEKTNYTFKTKASFAFMLTYMRKV